MFMFGITTFMFVLGIIALVLETAFGFQQMQLFLDPTAGNVWSSARTNVIIAVGATITRLMVRSARFFHAVCFINGSSVYSERYHLRLARGGSLEQRQARHRHPSALRPWDHRYTKWITHSRHPVLIGNLRFQLPPGVTLVSASHPYSAQPTRVFKMKAT
jgi:hypothetical protein